LRTLDDVNVKGKVCFVRCDLNCSVKEGIVKSSDRIKAAAETLKELSIKGARTVILSHQGRVGGKDFIGLGQHARLLEGYVGRKINFVEDLFFKTARDAIKNLKDGDIMMLENTRFFAEEEVEQPPEAHAKTMIISRLAPLGSIFILEAFSAAHRPHATVVGFAPVLGAVVGRAMEKEVVSLRKGMDSPKAPLTVILGGAKIEDSVKIINSFMPKADNILVGGMVANMMLLARGIDIGKSAEAIPNEMVEKAKEFAGNQKIIVPESVGVDERGERKEMNISELPSTGEILDIGEESAKKFAEIIRSSKTAVMNGPVGVYEREGFGIGTKIILEAMKDVEFSLLGGGNTVEAITKAGLYVHDFGHVSLAGKAFVEYLLGEKLIGVEILEKYPYKG